MSTRLKAVAVAVGLATVLGLWTGSVAAAPVPPNSPGACYPREICFSRDRPVSYSSLEYLRQFGSEVGDYRVHPWYRRGYGWSSQKVHNMASGYWNNSGCRIQVFDYTQFRGDRSLFYPGPAYAPLAGTIVGSDRASSHRHCV